MQNIKNGNFTTYILFYFLGTVTLIPFNFFTTATEYWMYKFRDINRNENHHYNSDNRTELQAEFIADYSLVSHLSNAVFIILTIFFIRRLTILIRIISTLFGTIATFFLTCIFVKIDTDSWQIGFMVLTLIVGCILTGFCGIFLVTLFEMAPKFPTKYLAVIFSGQAICGILAALVQIISLSINDNPEVNGIIYFGTALLFLILTLIWFLLSLKFSSFFQFHFNKEIQIEKIDVSKDKVLSILDKVKYYLATMLLSSGSTVMLHPGVTSLVISVNKNNGSKWNDLYFSPVITFLVYCTSDYIGRETATILKKPSNGLVLVGVAFLRLAFVPMLMLCNARPRHHLPVVFDEDYIYIIFIIIFAWSNGFLMNLCIISATNLPDEEEKPLAMFFLMIFMIVSIAICSFVGAGLVKAL